MLQATERIGAVVCGDGVRDRCACFEIITLVEELDHYAGNAFARVSVTIAVQVSENEITDA